MDACAQISFPNQPPERTLFFAFVFIGAVLLKQTVDFNLPELFFGFSVLALTYLEQRERGLD